MTSHHKPHRAFGLTYLLIELFYIGMVCGADGRAYSHMV